MATKCGSGCCGADEATLPYDEFSTNHADDPHKVHWFPGMCVFVTASGMGGGGGQGGGGGGAAFIEICG